MAASSPESSATLITELHRIVDLTLRYLAAGGSAVLAFGVVQGKNFEFLRSGPTQPDVSGWLLLLHVAVLGVAIYAVHRAIIFRLVHIPLFAFVGRLVRPPLGPCALQDRIRELMIQHRQSRPPHPWSNAFDTWSAECHFLYCSAWGTLLAVGLAQLLGLPWDITSKICLSVGATLFVAALIHDGAAARKIMEKYTTTEA